MSEGQTHPWREKFIDKHATAKQKDRLVRFNPNYLEIPAPDYDPEKELAPLPVRSGEAKTWSSLKKAKIPCRNAENVSGALSVNGGRIIFTHEDRKSPPIWYCNLGDVIHIAVAPANTKDSEVCSLKISLRNRQRYVFSNVPVSANAFEILVDDAALVGYVLVLDQLRQDADSVTFNLSDGLEHDSKKKKQAPLMSMLVTKHTKRFVNDRFNLDLSYITKRVIVMSFPGDGVKGVAHNNLKDVKRFFDERHPHSYMIYNINADPKYTYDDTKFDGRVRKFGFPDHSPPPLVVMISMCHDIAAYLRQAPANVVAVHCKAGKGRSGTIVCGWMLHSRLVESADVAVSYFNHMRMEEGQLGINLPSQLRYVKYMETIGNEGLPPERVAMVEVLEFEPPILKKGSLIVSVQCGSKTSVVEAVASARKISLDDQIRLTHDVRFDILIDGGKTPVCTAFFNVRMLPTPVVTFTRKDLDGAREYKAFKNLPEDFTFRIRMKFIADDNVDLAMPTTVTERTLSPETPLENLPPGAKEKSIHDSTNPIPRKATGWINRDWRNEYQQPAPPEEGTEDSHGHLPPPPLEEIVEKEDSAQSPPVAADDDSGDERHHSVVAPSTTAEDSGDEGEHHSDFLKSSEQWNRVAAKVSE